MSIKKFAANLVGAAIGFTAALVGVAAVVFGAACLGTATLGIGPLMMAEPIIEMTVGAVQAGIKVADVVSKKLGGGFLADTQSAPVAKKM